MPDAPFIVFEGGEGAGKTTIIAALAAALQSHGHDVLLTREPGGTPEGSGLRALLLAGNGPAWDKNAELLLITAARIQHINHVIAPALRAKKTVLCDRYIGSTLAYQGAGRQIPPDHITYLHQTYAGGLMPHLTVLLDLDPSIGLARSKRRLQSAQIDEARFENLDLAFHNRVRASFLAQATQTPTLIINAERDQPTVQNDVITQVQAWING